MLAAPPALALVEERRAEATARFVREIAARLAGCAGAVHVWDWRVLEEVEESARRPGMGEPGESRTERLCAIEWREGRRVPARRDGRMVWLDEEGEARG